MSEFRVIDTGLRGARENIAFDSALLEAHKAGSITDTIRFLRFRPSALVGRHQALSREVDLSHCRAAGIEVARRITGGGAIYFDQGQLGWELVFRRHTLGLDGLAGVTKGLCEAAAAGLSGLGIDARYRPRNDIEVDGRKLCGTGGFFDGESLFYQGTVLVDTDPSAMVAALRVPQAKLAKRQLDSAAGRVVTLRELLGEGVPSLDEVRDALIEGFRSCLGIEPVAGAVSDAEEQLAAEILAEEIGTDAFVAEIDDPGAVDDVLTGSHTGAGGTVTAYLRLEAPPGARGADHGRLLRHPAADGLRPGGSAAWCVRRRGRGDRRAFLRRCARGPPERDARGLSRRRGRRRRERRGRGAAPVSRHAALHVGARHW
jgi:lipoate-protein ligase A